MRDKMDICISCGSIAPTARKDCSWCSASFETHRKTVLPPGNELMPVLVEGWFDCRGCGAKVPLNHYSTEGYLCGSCGVVQQFEAESWKQIFKHAQNMADLTGFQRPSDEETVFWNMFEELEGATAEKFHGIGVEHSCVSMGQSSSKDIPFQMDASPGAPLCAACQGPLVLERTEDGLTARCDACGETAVYSALPVSLGSNRWAAAVCDEHRSDTRPVAAEASAGGAALAITCPNCSGALNVDALGSLVSCPYCGTKCHVPAQISSRISGKVLKRRWWLVFEGESKQRRKIRLILERQEKVERDEEAQNREQLQELERLLEIETKKARRNLILVGLGIAAALAVAAALVFLS